MSRLFSIRYTITGLKNIVCYTKDFVYRGSFNGGSTVSCFPYKILKVPYYAASRGLFVGCLRACKKSLHKIVQFPIQHMQDSTYTSSLPVLHILRACSYISLTEM